MSEWSAVQKPMLVYADQIGWTRVSQKQALKHRGGTQGLFFEDVLTTQLIRLNPGVVDGTQAAEIIRQLNLLTAGIAGNRDMLAWMRGENSVFVPSENRERNVRLIDFENPGNNEFHVTDEWRYKGSVFANRADVVFLINGIPVALAETKKAGKPDGLAEGVEQIRRYHRETPELLITPQVFEVTQLLDFYYGVTWVTNRKNIFNWNEEDAEDYEQKVKAFFDIPRFLKVLKDYIVFLTKDDNLTKIILRQHQTQAVEKVIDRVYHPEKRRGLIWHTQGSGKTLTMITIASKLLREAEGEKPTVLMIVDRNELEQQLFRNIASYGISHIEVAQSKQDLQQIMGQDYRGLVVSMIHKFDKIPPAINQRSSIVVLIDEAHRSTGGDLGNYLVAALPNATFIGFTGTPIDNLAQGKGTFKVFGIDDPSGYTDKYSVSDSIEDGTTVKLNYALAPSSLLVNRDLLEKEFFALSETEGVSDIEELNAILNRAVVLKEAMKSPERVDKVAAYVAKHYKENVEPMGFKAFLVGVDREACALYKKALDQHLPEDYSQVVYSAAHNDSLDLKEHYLSTDEEKALRRSFREKGSFPKILLVTQKLLTGFDAPILYCMYLDKPMRDHVLLQAIARVNRPYEDDDGLTKPYGFVLDFVGIFEKLEKALAFDSDVVETTIQNMDVLKDRFARLMKEEGEQYLPLAAGWTDKDKEQAINSLADKETREAFFKSFRQLQNLYDIISPDAFLRPYIDDYKALGELFGLIRNAYSSRVYVDRELTAKTKALLRQHTDSSRIEVPGEIHELGPKELAALKKSGVSDSTKILNLRKILNVTISAESGAKPFLVPIGERAEAVAEAYQNRQLTTQQTLQRYLELADEYLQAEANQEELGVDANTYAIFVTLNNFAEVTAAQAAAVNALFNQFPDYEWNDHVKSGLRRELYIVLRDIVGAAKMIKATNALLNLDRV